MVDVFAFPCDKFYNEKINRAKKLEFELIMQKMKFYMRWITKPMVQNISFGHYIT